MKLYIYILTTFTLLCFSAETKGQTDTTRNAARDTSDIRHGRHFRFIDRDGDGYNDYAPDHDNDGIPNGLDADYRRGRGKRQERGFKRDSVLIRMNKGRHYMRGKFWKDTTQTDTLSRPYRPRRR